MLVIRGDQMKVLSGSVAGSLAASLVEPLVAKYPQQCAALGGQTGTNAFLDRTVAKASEWGITSSGATFALAELFVQFGEEFQRSPFQQWSFTILRNPVMAGDLKVDTVWHRHASLTGGRQIVMA